MPAAVLHDGSLIEFTVDGDGPALLISTGLRVPDPTQDAEALAHGLDPHPGARLIRLLSLRARVISFDYEQHIFEHPKHRSLTVENIAQDILAIATAAGVNEFAFYASSWLALAGQHLATISDRLTGYAMGGFPPLHPPLSDLLALARGNHAAIASRRPQGLSPAAFAPDRDTSPFTRQQRAGESHAFVRDPFTGRSFAADSYHPSQDHASVPFAVQVAQARQFVTFFADALNQPHLTALPDQTLQLRPSPLRRMCFVGANDVLPGPDGTVLSMAAPTLEHSAALTTAGWTVHILKDADALDALQPQTAAKVLLPWIKQLPPNTTTHPTKATIPASSPETSPVLDMKDHVNAEKATCRVPDSESP